MTNESNQQLLIRFRGICAHIDLESRKENEEKRKRTVLVRHRNGNSGIEHHFPYIEFYADDIESFPPEVKVVQYSRPGFDGRLARIDLEDGTEIRIKDLEPGWVKEEANYRRDVPHMSDVLRSLMNGNGNGRNNGHGEAAQALTVNNVRDIDLDRTAAVFDMPEGRLLAGEPEAMITRFEKKIQFEPRRFARWSDLYITCPTPVTLQLKSLSTSVTREVEFRPTLRMLTIGNEPERLILGILPEKPECHHGLGHAMDHDPFAAPPQPTGHFVLYYDLLDAQPKERPVPIPTQLTGSGCPNNNYP